MINYEILENRISLLGGVQRNPSCDDVNMKNSEVGFAEFETFFNCEIPESYKHICKKYGAFSFKKSIKVKCEDLNPVADEKNKVTVDYFYEAANNGKCSIGHLLEQYAEYLPKNLFPICDGEPGDLICINLNSESYGIINYWCHETNNASEVFLIAQTFDDFILKLEVSDEGNQDDEMIKDVKVEVSPDFLEMLKRTGFGPK